LNLDTLTDNIKKIPGGIMMRLVLAFAALASVAVYSQKSLAGHPFSKTVVIDGEEYHAYPKASLKFCPRLSNEVTFLRNVDLRNTISLGKEINKNVLNQIFRNSVAEYLDQIQLIGISDGCLNTNLELCYHSSLEFYTHLKINGYGDLFSEKEGVSICESLIYRK
jgi:hypothetical protein